VHTTRFWINLLFIMYTHCQKIEREIIKNIYRSNKTKEGPNQDSQNRPRSTHAWV